MFVGTLKKTFEGKHSSFPNNLILFTAFFFLGNQEVEVFSAAGNDNIFDLTLKFSLFLHLHLHLFHHQGLWLLSSLRWGWFRLTNIYRLHIITETTYDRSYLKVDLFCQVQMLLEASLSHCLDMVLWVVMNIVLWFTKISSIVLFIQCLFAPLHVI